MIHPLGQWLVSVDFPRRTVANRRFLTSQVIDSFDEAQWFPESTQPQT